MPIVDSSRPSHSAPPFEPWLTGSGLLLLFWVGAGACAYLRKPLDERLLLNAISAALGAAAQLRR